MNIVFRTFSEGASTSQRTLFRRAFPETAGTSVESVSHYNWKFRGLIFNPPSFEYAGDLESRIVAYYAALPYKYKVNGREAVAGMVCDVMTDPEFQGKGLFTKIGRYATSDLKDRGVDFTTGFPIRPEVIPGHLKVGWVKAFQLPVYLKVMGLKSILEKFGMGFIAKPLDLLWRKCFGFSNSEQLAQTLDFRELSLNEPLFSELEDFFSRANSKYFCYLQKDKHFLKWRFSAPDTQYNFIISRDKTQAINGVAIVRPSNLKGIESLSVLDFECESLRAQDNIQSEMKRLANSLRKDVISLMCSNHTYKIMKLRRNLFFQTPFKFTFIMKALSDKFDSKRLQTESAWNLFWIDSDDL
jgi:hypothetical protein